MTFDEIKASTKDVLVPQDVAEVLGVNPQSIRNQAQYDPHSLGFNVAVVGTRTIIPRIPFIQFMERWKGERI